MFQSPWPSESPAAVTDLDLISSLRAIPDTRLRRGNHLPAWYLLLVAISQACYATGENHERAVLKQLLGELDLQGLLIQADALHTFLTSLRTAPEGMLQLARNRWSIKGWHWMRDTQLHEDAHRYPGNGAGVMGSLRTAAL